MVARSNNQQKHKSTPSGFSLSDISVMMTTDLFVIVRVSYVESVRRVTE
jgi:hypothetical protein